MSDDLQILTQEEAIAMLPSVDRIHTFRQGGFGLVGADWSREDIIKVLGKYQVELSGEVATNMNHGIVLEDNHGYLFIETTTKEPTGV